MQLNQFKINGVQWEMATVPTHIISWHENNKVTEFYVQRKLHFIAFIAGLQSSNYQAPVQERW